MLPLPARFAGIILAFAPLFVHRSWRHAQLLLIGAILTPGRRTVASVLRITGRAGAAVRERPPHPQPHGMMPALRQPHPARDAHLSLRIAWSGHPCAR